MRRRRAVPVAILMVWLGWPSAAGAHRLDEYLQATRVSLEIDHVNLEIDLTPGASMASAVFGRIDRDGDGHISPPEGASYAQEVLGAVMLSTDGHRAAVTLVESQFPDARDMDAGVGTVRLRATAKTNVSRAGQHVLVYSNAHWPETSVYLVNALLPSDRHIAITSQQRDFSQHRLTLEYDVSYGGWWRTLSLVAGGAIVGLLIVARKMRER